VSPRGSTAGGVPDAIADFLKTRPDGATMKEIADTIQARRSVPRHSIRSAVFQNADGHGRKLFVIDRRGQGRSLYRLAD
jgi:hypothetical protein